MTELKEKVFRVAAAQRKSPKTAKRYLEQSLDYSRFIRRLPPDLTSEEKVRRWLEDMAPRVAAGTQSQAWNAVRWFYTFILERPLGKMDRWEYAKRPKKLPAWLNRSEVSAVLAQMSGTTKLMAQLCYGGGLRLNDCTRLRIKDLDMEQGVIVVRAGKGEKDRVTCLPRSLNMAIRTHLARVRQLWEQDRQRNRPGVQLPFSLDKKYPSAPKEWAWFWVFPAAKESTDPDSGIVRRHHATDSSLQKAVRRAYLRSGVTKKTTPHTLRHSFAVHMVQKGVGIDRISAMLGHKSVETTMIYLHCAERFEGLGSSPLDDAQVIEFPGVCEPEQVFGG